MKRFGPIVALVLLAPVIAEVLIGDVPFTPAGAVGLLFSVPIYGAGAVLVRELVWRRGRGWPSILMLGVAYGIVEEGIALTSLFSATVYNGLGPAWGARVFGINGVYTEVQLINHAVWSVAVPILLVESLFPGWRRTPALGRFGIVVTGFFFVMGVAVLALPHLATQSAPFRIGSIVVVAVLAVISLGVFPRTAPAFPGHGTAPTPWLPFSVGLIGGFGCLGLLVYPSHFGLSYVRGPLVAIPMLADVVLVVLIWILVSGWSRTTGWHDVHLLALGGGALLGHSLLWGTIQPKTVRDYVVVAVLFVVTAIVLAMMAKRTKAS